MTPALSPRSPAAILLDAFRAAALKGERAPDNARLADMVYQAGGKQWAQALHDLAASGKIRIEICGKNWRVVYLVAENINTALEPNGRAAYRVIDKNGSRKM